MQSAGDQFRVRSFALKKLRGIMSTIKLSSADAGTMRPALFRFGERLGFAALERILAGVVLDLQRRAFQLEYLAKSSLQITGIA